MAIITFLSDFGDSDHYIAAVKAKILSENPNQVIVDISHKVEPCDIAHGAFLLKSVFRDFPKGTIHIVAVNSVGNAPSRLLAVSLEGHYFITTDHGLLGIISDVEPDGQVDLNPDNVITTFPAKTHFAAAASQLAQGAQLTALGPNTDPIKKMMGRHLKANKNMISGHVIRVDSYGNLITNIDRYTFDILSKGKSFNITFGRENMRRIHDNFYSADAGDATVIFNEQGLLMVGINQGNANELLGLGYDSPVMVKFE